MDGQRDSVMYDCCPSCQGPLVLKNSAKGNSYQSCPKSQGGCGWWTGQKEGEVFQKQSQPQKRNFSVNQGGHGNFRGGQKYSKPNPQPQQSYSVSSPPPPQPQGNQLPSKPTVVVESAPQSEVSMLLLELFRQQLQQSEVNEEISKEVCDKVQTLQQSIDTLQNSVNELKTRLDSIKLKADTK